MHAVALAAAPVAQRMNSYWSVETLDLEFQLTVATGIELQLKAHNAAYICASRKLSGGKNKNNKTKHLKKESAGLGNSCVCECVYV